MPSEWIELRVGITRVPLRTETRPPATHTNCYVIGAQNVIVIDPGSSDGHEQAILDRCLQGRHVREVWLTHRHPDHIGGAPHLRERLDVPIAAHPVTARDLEGSLHVDRVFQDDERLELPGAPGWILHVIHTPGHARGHISVFEEKSRSMFTGDLVAGVGTVVIDPPEGHMATYCESLRRMKTLQASALFPAHGPMLADPESALQEYLDHRAAREMAILGAWERGIQDVRDIVKAVYEDLPSGLHPLAERSVIAHLEKLRDERKIQ